MIPQELEPDDPQAQFYDRAYALPRSYKARFAGLKNLLPSLNRWQLAAALLAPGERILDVGCGAGQLLKLVAPHFAELHGLDISQANIQRATEFLTFRGSRPLVKLGVLNLDKNNLPYPDAYFDSVSLVSVLQFVFDIFHLLKEVRRVLKPGGYLVMETNNLASFGNRVRILLGRQPRTSSFEGWDGNVLHYFVLHSTQQLLTKYGFRNVNVSSAGTLYPVRSLWPSLLAQNLMFRANKA